MGGNKNMADWDMQESGEKSWVSEGEKRKRNGRARKWKRGGPIPGNV